MDKIIIEVTGDPKGVQSTIDQLEKIGKVDKKNADQFKEHHNQYTKQNKESFDMNTKLTRSFQDLGEGIIAGFAIERVVEFGKASVKAFAEMQEATSKLKFSIMEVNGESKFMFDNLVRQAEESSIKLKNLYKSKDIMGSQSQLANYGLDATRIQSLTPRILDIAAAKNITLAEATEKVIMAMNGQTRGLRDIGAAFKDTGSKSENYNKFLEKTAKFSGAATEKSNTLAGSLQEISNNYEAFKEEFGKGVVEVFGSVFTGIQAIVRLAHELFDSTDEFIDKHKEDMRKMDEANEKELNASDLMKKLKANDLNSAKEYKEKIKKLNDDELKEKIENFDKETALLETVVARQKSNVSLRKDINEGLTKEEIQRIGDITNAHGLSSDKRLKMLNDELEKRIKLEDDATELGKQKKAAALDALLKMQEQFYKDLEAIRIKDADDNDKFNIELIRDETEKKLAAQDSAFRKEQEDFKKREEKLSEIMKKGKIDQRIKAKIEYDNLFKAEELAQKAHDANMLKIQQEADRQQEEFESKQRETRLEWDKKQIEYAEKNSEIELKKQLINKKISQKDYDKQLKELQLKALEDKLKLEQEYGIEDVELQQEIEDKKLELQKDNVSKLKEVMQTYYEYTMKIFEGMSEEISSNIEVINTQMERQQKLVDVQKALAIAGYENTLAFEAKKADDLEKKKLEEQKKLKKIKELEVFLNSVATYTGEGNNPMQAISKALAVLAATKAAEAVYAEDGAVIGKHSQTSSIGLSGFSRRHRSGKDYLLHAEEGERVLSVEQNKRFELLGGLNSLKNPFSAKIDRVGNSMYVNNNRELVSEIQDLKQAILNKKETTYDYEGMDLRITEIENGLKKITRVYRA